MKKVRDTYKETRVFETPRAIVRVRIPDLDDEEQARRMKQLYNASVDVLKAIKR